MNSNNSDNQENERKAENKPGDKDRQRDGDYGGSDYGREENVNEGWQAGATEYDVNYREQGFSSSSQSEPDKFGISREEDRYRNRGREADSMGVEQAAHAGDVPNTDELISEEVHMLLKHQSDFDLSNVEVTVREGEVFLEGTVREPISNRQLDEAIAMIAGVQHLHNRLRIIEDTPPMESRNTQGDLIQPEQTSSEAQRKRDFPTSS
jgi:osmotically-inducible protein OsmY